MKTNPPIHRDPAPRPSTRRRPPKSPPQIADQINAEDSVLVNACPLVFKPNKISFTGNWNVSWIAPNGNLVADWTKTPSNFMVKLFADDERCEITGTGATVRDAYADACHLQRLAQHDIGDLFHRAAELEALADVIQVNTTLTENRQEAHDRIEETHVVLWQMAGTITRGARRIADLEHALEVEECAHAKTRIDKSLAVAISTTIAKNNAATKELVPMPEKAWSDDLSQAAVREGWHKLPIDRREEIAMRLLDDLCKPPHERGSAWHTLIMARNS